MDSSIVFAKVHIDLYKCFLGHTRIHIPNAISVALAVFCTDHGEYPYIYGRPA